MKARADARDPSALALRAVLIAYAVLVVAIRFPAAWPWPALEAGGPTLAAWLLTGGLTLLPLVCALRMTTRRLFGAALVLALYGTYEVIALRDPSLAPHLAEHWPWETAWRALLLIAVWGMPLWLSRAERRPGRGATTAADGRIAAALLLAYALPSLEAFRGVLLLSDFEHPTRYSMWIPVGVTALGTLGAALLLRERGRGPGDPAPGQWYPLVLGLLMGLAAAVWQATFHAWTRGTWLPQDLHAQWPGNALILSLVIVPPLEEWAYRGVLWAALRKRIGVVATWVVTSTAFGLCHLLMGPVSHMPEQIGMGLIFGWLRWKTGRVWPAMLAHMVANALLLTIA